MELNGRNILITGGRRVGAKLAVQLAGRGANLALSYFQSRETIEAVVADVSANGVRGLAVQADLRQPADVDRMIQTVVDEFGSLDCLINMASTFHATPFDELTADDFDANIASNLKAPYLTAVAAARAMRNNSPVEGLQGKIVNFADWAVYRPYRDFLPYLIAKGGVVTMTAALAVELAPSITVNAVAPAMIDPPPHLTEEQIESIRQASPLKRIGVPEDANNLVLYLLEGSDFVTGEVFRVDGGRFLGTDHL